MKLWDWLARFLHRADLMPLVVVVSVYHYYQALKSHDPIFVALPIALFIDLLHYRSVQRAVKSSQVGWWVAAVVTTAAAFGLQWMFYARAGESGTTLVWWQALIFASIVPVGLAIWAWLQLSVESDAVTDWQAEIAAAQKLAEEAQTQAATAKAEALAAQKSAQEAQAKAERAQRLAETAQTEATRWQHAAEAAQNQVNEWQPMVSGWLSLNKRFQLVAMVNAGLLPKEQAMSELSLSRRTVEQDMARLNGVNHE